MKCVIENFIDGRWVTAATMEVDDPKAGASSACAVTYDTDYVIDEGPAISATFTPTLDRRRYAQWPGFIVDMVPQGAGRRRVLANLGLDPHDDGPHNDWMLLRHGAGNPPGSLRVAEAAPPRHPLNHPGFDRSEVVDQREEFIEYAFEHGAAVAGSSGLQGEAPKYLLTTDPHGRFHVDGVIPDDVAREHYLVKFPRGKTEQDFEILRNEAPYYEVARAFGLHVAAPLVWDEGILFIRRFDREVTPAGLQRYGLESLYALAEVGGFARALSHETLVNALAVYSTNPAADVVEYIMRDVLNVALLNTDNHGRNTAVLKRDGTIRLSPLYDFAPMYLDDAGIARVCRWSDERETRGRPNWGAIADYAAGLDIGIDGNVLRQQLAATAAKVRALPGCMRRHRVDEHIVTRIEGHRTEEVAQALESAAPATMGRTPRPGARP